MSTLDLVVFVGAVMSVIGRGIWKDARRVRMIPPASMRLALTPALNPPKPPPVYCEFALNLPALRASDMIAVVVFTLLLSVFFCSSQPLLPS